MKRAEQRLQRATAVRSEAEGEWRAAIRAASAEGMSHRKIAPLVGVSHQRVAQLLRE